MSDAEFSRRERQIMDILYAKGPSTVAQVTSHMPDDLSRNAIRTFLTLLVGKRKVTRTKEGREFIYSRHREIHRRPNKKKFRTFTQQLVHRLRPIPSSQVFRHRHAQRSTQRRPIRRPHGGRSLQSPPRIAIEFLF